jgi:hypothetical protein
LASSWKAGKILSLATELQAGPGFSRETARLGFQCRLASPKYYVAYTLITENVEERRKDREEVRKPGSP